MVCAWNKLRFHLGLSRINPSASIARDAFYLTRPLFLHSDCIIHFNTLLDMDSDEDMHQIDSDLPALNKGKGKAVLQDGTEDTTIGKDDTLPWYMKSSCDENLDQQRVHTGLRNTGQ